MPTINNACGLTHKATKGFFFLESTSIWIYILRAHTFLLNKVLHFQKISNKYRENGGGGE